MNLVGRHGKGESVWLGFFLCHVLGEFAKVARVRNDPSFADRCAAEATQLRQRIEDNAWDGAWYRRAYFDDGSPSVPVTMPNVRSIRCAELGGAIGSGNGARSRMAMNAVNARLVRREHALIQLLDPPFDIGSRARIHPGYVPGVRENGGQYTHGAIWAAMGFAALGEAERAWELTAMINPINHAEPRRVLRCTRWNLRRRRRRLRPRAAHGAGGWTWYTGSAGWMYRLSWSPCWAQPGNGSTSFRAVPAPEWNEFRLHYRYRETYYHIVVRQIEMEGDAAMAAVSVTVDGTPQPGNFVDLADDCQEHHVEVRIRSNVKLHNRALRQGLLPFPEFGPYWRLLAIGRP